MQPGDKKMTKVFFLKDAWRVMVDGEIVPAEFNSKGAATAAIEVERRRRVSGGSALRI